MRLASTARNENTAISRLPSEIFLHICQLACPQTTHHSAYRVIALTHICRRWRCALLSYPIIWSNIYMWRNSPELLVATLLRRSRGVPLTVNIQYYSDRTLRFGCGCSHQPTWEAGDYCGHKPEQMPSLDLLEPFRATIHTLNVRYLRKETFDDGTMEDILKTPFFLGSFPNLESLRWSCSHLNGTGSGFKLPRKLFGSSLPRLQKLSMVNCWGLLLTDTPMLKMMSVECTTQLSHIDIPANQFVHSLRRRQSLTSLSIADCNITPDPNNIPSPVSMKNLKNITLRNVHSSNEFRYLQCPSIGTFTTLRIAPFIRGAWADGRSVGVTATDSSGGSVSSLVHLISDTLLATTWEALALVFQHSVTTLEVVDLHMIMSGDKAIAKLINVLPNLHTIRARLPPVAGGFEALREILSRKHGITLVERLVVEGESPDEARRNDEKWKALCVAHKVHEFLV